MAHSGYKGTGKDGKGMLSKCGYDAGMKTGGKVKKMASGGAMSEKGAAVKQAHTAASQYKKGGAVKKMADGGAMGPKMDAGAGGGKGRLEKTKMAAKMPKKAMKKGGKC